MTSLECLNQHQTMPFLSTRQAKKWHPSSVLQASPPSLVAVPKWCHFRAEVHLYPCWPQRHSLISRDPNLTLPNGLRIATEFHLLGCAAVVSVWIYSRSHFESNATNDMAHFLERMVFKGIEKRSAKGFSEGNWEHGDPLMI